MSLFKQSILTIMLIAFGSCYAGEFVCNDQPVNLPCDKKGWHVFAEGLYLETANDDLEYLRNPFVTPAEQYGVEPNYRFAMRFGGTYHFGDGDDIALDWMRFDRSFFGHYRLASLVPTTYRSKSSIDFDAFNFELARMMNVGERSDLRLFFGAHLLKLEHHLSLLAEGDINFGVKYISNFDGIGPRVGVDWFYHLASGFQWISRAGMSVLIGETDSEIQGNQTAPNFDPLLEKSTRRTIVPQFEARSAIRWSTEIGKGIMSIEGGWQFTGYYQAVHHQLTGSTQQNVSNFMNHGPFFSILYAG